MVDGHKQAKIRLQVLSQINAMLHSSVMHSRYQIGKVILVQICKYYS